MVIDTDQQERVLGIQFRAGGEFPFFAIPASEAEGQSIDLEVLWPTHARRIRDQLLNAHSVPAMFQLLERHLLEDRFAELFRQQVGLTPKVFCRVLRFQRVLKTLREAKDLEWNDVALSCGYYDQAHFIHDCQSFSGFTPSAYHAAATPHLNHVPLT